jgi:hypothetical protein
MQFNLHASSVELLSIHVTETLPRSDGLERRGLFSSNEVLADGESRVACEADVAVAEGEFCQEFDHVVSIFGVLGTKEFDIA